MSLANIATEFRMRASHHAFVLAALLPCPHFICPKSYRGVLESRVKHWCINIVCNPLKVAAHAGRMMTDPRGFSRWCFTPLVSYIVDNPEAQMIAGVDARSSAVTLATYKQFGDDFRHEPRTSSTTLAQLAALALEAPDPWNLEDYLPKAKKRRLNGVFRPFWADWALSDPSSFLTPEILHQQHKQFWDHDMKWCRQLLGDAEIDFRYSVLHPRVGFRIFHEGISPLKQVTGREHRDIQRYIIACIAGAAPSRFIVAIRALMDFRYLSQSPLIDAPTIDKISNALKEFHDNKSAVIEAGARRGKRGVIDNWYIPKIELMQSVAPSIRAMGAPIQYTADTTEHSHIRLVKEPFRASNHRDFDPQICRYLDRAEKCGLFDIATTVRTAQSAEFVCRPIEHADHDDVSDNDDHPAETTVLFDSARPSQNFFALSTGKIPTGASAPRVFSTESTAFRLTVRPSIHQVSIDKAATLFLLPDLRPALLDYFRRCHSNLLLPLAVGGRRTATTPHNSQLPFDAIEVWYQVRVQTRSVFAQNTVLPSHLVQACPPSEDWPYGRNDPVLIINDKTIPWPGQGVKGEHQFFNDKLQLVCAD